MITRQELEIQARGIEQRAKESRIQSRSIGEPTLAPAAASMPLFTFPDSTVKIKKTPGEEALTRRILRRIDAAEGRSGTEYRLIEEEWVSDSEGRDVRRFDPVALMAADNALETLNSGFQRIDEDRLIEGIEPIVNHIRANGYTTEDWGDAVNRIQQLAASLDLSTASQMRVKSDAIDLIEGRLDLGDFVARTVARQECFEVAQRVRESSQFTESIEV